MDTILHNICPIHQVPLKDGKCPICNNEPYFSSEKAIKAQPGINNKSYSDKHFNQDTCPNCGKKISPNASFCVFCGAELSVDEQQDSKQEIHQYSVKLVLSKNNMETSSTSLEALSKPSVYYGELEEIEFLYYPELEMILIQNSRKAPWYFTVDSPSPVYNNQEIRLGEIGFLLKYAERS